MMEREDNSFLYTLPAARKGFCVSGAYSAISTTLLEWVR